jgi:hypothetical protein
MEFSGCFEVPWRVYGSVGGTHLHLCHSVTGNSSAWVRATPMPRLSLWPLHEVMPLAEARAGRRAGAPLQSRFRKFTRRGAQPGRTPPLRSVYRKYRKFQATGNQWFFGCHEAALANLRKDLPEDAMMFVHGRRVAQRASALRAGANSSTGNSAKSEAGGKRWTAP